MVMHSYGDALFGIFLPDNVFVKMFLEHSWCRDFGKKGFGAGNTAFFLGRDGREIGRYHKVQLPVHEQLKEPGDRFPVFETPDLGGVGMLICYDMVFPETARCMALNGADILFNPTLGGAAFGGWEISRAAFRTRAVENLYSGLGAPPSSP